MTLEVPLVGAGGEPVDLRRTIGSHGVARLDPQRILEGGRAIELPIRLRDGKTTLLRIAGEGDRALVHAYGDFPSAMHGAEIVARVRHILALDADFTPFYERAARDPELAWVARGAGRFIRSATVFEDVVKTVCTTNCSFTATIRMTSALVRDLGEPVPDTSGVRLFPTPAAMAGAGEDWYRDVARAGYRGPYLRALAAAVVAGTLDFDALASASPGELPDDELELLLRALPGIGPYAAAHIMMLIGRYSRLVFDSWTRPAYVRLSGKRVRSDAAIVRRFKPYGRFAGLAFWCYVTSDWVEESAASIAAATTGSVSSPSA